MFILNYINNSILRVTQRGKPMDIILIVGISVLVLFALLTTSVVVLWLISQAKSAIGFSSRPDASNFQRTERTIPGKKSGRFD